MRVAHFAHCAVYCGNGQHTCSSSVRFDANSFALSSGFSRGNSFFAAIASPSSGDVGVSEGVTVSTGVTSKLACLRSITLFSSSVGLRVPKCMVAMAARAYSTRRQQSKNPEGRVACQASVSKQGIVNPNHCVKRETIAVMRQVRETNDLNKKRGPVSVKGHLLVLLGGLQASRAWTTFLAWIPKGKQRRISGCIANEPCT